MVFVLLAAAAPAGAASDPLTALKASCQKRTSPDHAKYRICTGMVPSFDGTPLDVTVTLPAKKSKKPLPLIAFLHGFLADKTEYLSETKNGTGADRGSNSYKTVHWNNIWFASRGYAVLNYSHRGHGNSGGQIELASRYYEVRDAQYLTGALVDAGRSLARINPRKVGVIGSSYGGGMAWMLLTTRPSPKLQFGTWRSPRGRLLKLAAVVPTYTWTDLLYSLAPNGRHLSDRVVDPKTAPDPTGISKQTLVDGFLATAGMRLPQQTYKWLARVNAGEPYDNPPDPVIAEAKHALTVDRSAYYQDDYFAALRAHRVRRVPVLAGEGWTDPIFPPIEALRMYRRLRQLSPGYPIQLYFGDFEHLTALAKVPDLARLHALGNRMLAHYLRGRGRRPRFDVRAAVTNCDPKAFGPVIRAPRWDRLWRRRASFKLGGPKQTASRLVSGGALADPVVLSQQRGRGCITAGSSPDGGAATYPIPVPAGTTLIGLPRLTVTYSATAPDFELNSRLWDVAGDGSRTLVARGAYRGGPSLGPAKLTYELWGNAWRVRKGHTLELELLQDDSTFLRADNVPSVVTIQDGSLDLPLR